MALLPVGMSPDRVQARQDGGAPCQQGWAADTESQSATGEEWEVCKNKKQQITGIMRGPEDPEQWLSCVDSSKEWGKLRLIVQQETAGRRDVWMR